MKYFLALLFLVSPIISRPSTSAENGTSLMPSAMPEIQKNNVTIVKAEVVHPRATKNETRLPQDVVAEMMLKSVTERPIFEKRTTKTTTTVSSQKTTMKPSRITTTTIVPIIKNVTQRSTVKNIVNETPSPIVNTEKPKIVEVTEKSKPITQLPSIEQLRAEIALYEASHKGEALPLTLEEIEREMAAVDIKLKESSTSKEGLSTWILLSGSKSTSVQPDMKGPTYRVSDQKMDKIARVKDTPNDRQNLNQQGNKKNEDKIKNKQRTTKAPLVQVVEEEDEEEYEEEIEENEENIHVEVFPPIKINKPKPVVNVTNKKKQPQPQVIEDDIELDPEMEVTTKKLRRPVTTITTTTTEQPESIQEYPEYETARPHVESTTFLIIEPKDSEYDLPQDRSPGNLTTKKPKRNSNNKNKKNQKKKPNKKLETSSLKNGTKTGLKKPQKGNKPMTTQIYNYLAREVMPTVGVGLVGLVVTAGLASYFLGPFAALRRSYDIADRKDDIYAYNNEEYAGSDGQNEEDMFGKVIAGMPSSALYRNNVRTHTYRPNQVYQSPAASVHYSGYKYSPYNRYRNVPYRPQPYQQQQQPHPQHQQQYRFNNQITDPQNIQKLISNSVNIQDPLTVYTNQQQADPSATIIEQSKSSVYGVDSIDNTLQHRSQFVVGSIVPSETIPTDIESETTSSVAVPEHGPRKRRSTEDGKSLENNEIDNENEIDGVIHVMVTKTKENVNEISTTTPTITESPTPSNDDDDRDASSTTIFPEFHPTGQQGSSFVEFFRRMLELKVRLGLAFLKNATNSFQQYLIGVEERVDSAPLFNRELN